jgi:uncharacterized protein with PIN domain
VTVRFYQELNDFLPQGLRSRPIEIARAPCTVFQLIQDLGVPHTEVDLVLVNGRSVGLAQEVGADDRVSVYPVFESLDISSVTRVRPEPLRRFGFLLDTHLGALARLLRMLGFDCDYGSGADDAELALRAAREGRVLLTRDRGLLKRRLVTRGYCVRSLRPEEQAVEVLRRFDLAAAALPLSRCLRCNAPLERLAAPPGTVPPAVRSSGARFFRCPRCLRTYWRGTHWRDMKRTVARVLSRVSAPPAQPRS